MKEARRTAGQTGRIGAASRPVMRCAKKGKRGERGELLHASIGFALLLMPCVPLLLPSHASAHHTSSIAYILQEVGRKKVGGVEMELRAMPPRLTGRAGAQESPRNAHDLLSRFTHRFEMRVTGNPGGEATPPKVDVQILFAQDEWRKTFSMKRLSEERPDTYGANVRLGEKGPYAVTATIFGLSPSPLRARFSFDFDPESVRSAMRDLAKTLSHLGCETLTLGLDGQAVPPQKERRIRNLAARFRYLAPWVSNLREGEEQELYDGFAQRLRDLAATIAASVQKADYDRLAGNLAAARALCSKCHRIFQEADSTGKPVRKSFLRPSER